MAAPSPAVAAAAAASYTRLEDGVALGNRHRVKVTRRRLHEGGLLLKMSRSSMVFARISLKTSKMIVSSPKISRRRLMSTPEYSDHCHSGILWRFMKLSHL